MAATCGERHALFTTVRLRDGDGFDLRITPVRKHFGDANVRMLAYNGAIPGPTLHVDQGPEITVRTTITSGEPASSPAAIQVKPFGEEQAMRWCGENGS